jgi:tape measure domain-containing protein
MAEVDPLVLEISANLGRYKAELRSSTALVTNQLGRQEKAVQNLERQMQRSSGAISGQLNGIAGALAGAFTGRELVGLLDNFTRLQNSLRVAGLEGRSLASVQGSLLDLSSKYGVSINELADLYGKSSQAASDLGASETQLLQITEASAQALKITGTSAVQAQGALLGLTQALASGTVRAEEFNQINEGGLRPLLQVAANAEKYGGSVAKLRQAVVDGKVSSQEFYTAILNGSAVLEGQASKATLTLSGAFAALGSNLTVYVGEASAANGVTAGLAAGIAALAQNLNVIIPALAIIGVAIGGRLAAAALVGGNSLRALAAYASVATTSLAGTALAARGAGAALLGAFGGPVGLAVTALTLGLGYLVTQTSASAVAAQANARAQEISASASKSGADAAERLASAHGAARVQALALAKAERENIKQKLASARASLVLAQAELARAKAFSAAQNAASIGATTPGGGLFIQGTGDVRKAREQQRVADQEARISGLEKGLGAVDAAIRNGLAPNIAAIGDPKKDKKNKGSKERKGREGPSAEEIQARFNSELTSITQQTLSAQSSIAKSAEERAEFELRSIELSRISAIEGIKNEKDYNATQKKRLIEQVERLASEEREGVALREREQLAQEAADLAEIQNRNYADDLKNQYDLAASIKERARLAQEIVDAEFEFRLSAIDIALLQDEITDAKRDQLQATRDGVIAERDRAKRLAAEGNQGPLAQYGQDLGRLNFGDEAEGFGVDALKELNRGLADAIVNGGNLGDVLEDTGKRFLAQLIEMTFQLLVIKPLLESLGGGASGGFGGGSGGGLLGGLLGSIGSLFGGARASGGPVSAGRVYRVNESQREFFQPDTNGKILTMSQMRNQVAASGQGGGVTVVRLELSGDIDARIQSQSAEVAVQVVQAAAPQIRDAAVSETFRRGNRPGFRK